MGRIPCLFWCVLIAIVSAASPLRAETLQAGTIELQPSIGVARSTVIVGNEDLSTTLDRLTGTLRVGRCFDSFFELTGSAFIQYQPQSSTDAASSAFGSDPSNSDDAASRTRYGATIGAQFQLPTTSKAMPYVGIDVGAIKPHTGPTVSLVPQLRAGLRVFLRRRVAVDASVGWQHQNDGGSTRASATFATVGLSLFPGRH